MLSRDMFEEGTNFKFLADTLADCLAEMEKQIVTASAGTDKRLTDQTKVIVGGMTILQDQYEGIESAYRSIVISLQGIDSNLAKLDKRLTALERKEMVRNGKF